MRAKGVRGEALANRRATETKERGRIEETVAALIARFVEDMLTLAREQLERDLKGFNPLADTPLLSIARSRSTRAPEEGPLFALRPPKRRVTTVHAEEFVEQMITIVHQLPWPGRSSELQALLGVKKDPFLRIAKLALATGRITRAGERAGIKYSPVR